MSGSSIELTAGRLLLDSSGRPLFSGGAPGGPPGIARLPGRVLFSPNAYGVVAPDLSLSANAALARTWAQPWSAVSVVDTTGAGTAGTTPSTGAGLIFTGSRSTGNAYTGYEQWFDNRGCLRVRIIANFSSGDYLDASTPAAVNLLSPAAQLVIGSSYDGSGNWSGIRMYVNGVAQTLHQPTEQGSTGLNTLTGSPVGSAGPMCIGNQLDLSYPATFYLPGYLRGLAFSNVVQPASWFAVGQGNVPPLDATIMGAWDFAATRGTKVPDLSPNGNVITLTGAGIFSRT